MRIPVNKSLDEFYARKNKQNPIVLNTDVSIITCTNVLNSLENILANFNRQDFSSKELIIIINNNEIDLDDWKDKTKEYENIRIYKLDQNISLGKCLNFGIEKANYGIIAKFDDDDYYGPKYLTDTIKYFYSTKAKLIGKGANFVYLVESKTMTIRDPHQENKYTNFVNGSTLVFRKEIFNRVRFRDINAGEDLQFCKDCVRINILIYSCSKYHHVYIRYPSKSKHTWLIEDDALIKLCCRPDIYSRKIDSIHDLKLYVDI